MPPEPRWITEKDVVDAVPLRDALRAVRDALAAQHAGTATTLEKTAATFAGSSTLHALGGIDEAAGLAGTKSWVHTAVGATPMLTVWDATTGVLRAVVEAFALGQLRTAAISAVAIDVLAEPDAGVMAMIGTGKQALAQVAAAVCVRPLRQVRVYSPTREHRHQFCATLSERLPLVDIIECDSVAVATDGAAVVTAATRATEPIIDRGMLADDVHVNALGAITPERRELAPTLVAVAARVVTDSPMAASTLSAELDSADEVLPLSDLVGSVAPRVSGLTVFKAMGLGLADVAVGALAVERVLRAGGGLPIPAPIKVAPQLFESAVASTSATGGRG